MFVSCEDQQEVDAYWEKLTDGGVILQCGWLTDKYGLTWQIIPKALPRLMGDKDPVKAKRVMDAMMQMKKIDVAGWSEPTAARKQRGRGHPARPAIPIGMALDYLMGGESTRPQDALDRGCCPPRDLGVDVQRAILLTSGLPLVARNRPEHLKLVPVRILAVDAEAVSVIVLAHVTTRGHEPIASFLDLLDLSELPGHVVHPDVPAMRDSFRVSADAEETEIVVVVAPTGLHEYALRMRPFLGHKIE